MIRALWGLGGFLLVFGWAAGVGAGPLDEVGYAKTVTCSGCHGFNGNSRVEAVPILAGMSTEYFKKAIEDYATGKRPSAEMEPFAKQVKLLGVDEVAAFFAAQKRQPASPKPDRPAVACRPSPDSPRRTSGTSSCSSRRTSGARATRPSLR
jgi:cytochrome c553